MCASQPQSADLLAVLRIFKAAQEKRVRQYVHFKNGFAEFLRSKDEAPYRQVMVDTTREFAEVNEVVHCAEARLRGDLARPDLAAHLRQLQEAEKAKLKFTLVQQALKREASQERFSWQQEFTAEQQSSSAVGETPLEGGSHPNGHRHCCSMPPEPTQEEFNNALAEATQELQAAVTTINDTLEELREAEEELLEDAA
ncbi:g7107 [Coccomyxa elongata]